jgi:predicted MarR family transcription regulator
MTSKSSSPTLAKRGREPVVSSAHLAAGSMPALSEYEFGLILASSAFNRWIVRCMAAAGAPGMSALDVLVLHAVNHRDRQKTLADLCLVLNIEDTHTVSYSLKKLERDGLIETGRQGKEKTAAISEKGAALCARYGEVREELLVRTVKTLSIDEEDLSQLSTLLRGLSGTYDQASRAAAAS